MPQAAPKPHPTGIGGESALRCVPPAAFPSLVRFLDFMQLQGLAQRTVESYMSKLRLLAIWSKDDPAVLVQETVKQFVLYCIRERRYSPQSLRLTRVTSGAFYNGLLELDSLGALFMTKYGIFSLGLAVDHPLA
jgi:hypothetical protein